MIVKIPNYIFDMKLNQFSLQGYFVFDNETYKIYTLILTS